MNNIARNIENINRHIDEAYKEKNCGLPKAKLIAVSKTKPVELLQMAYDGGARDFGENKVQEIMDKYEQLPDDIRWHMIGHLQTNKVKYIADKVYMIHSVDSVKLAEEISKRAIAVNRVIPILVEVNIGNEESKFGLEASQVADFVESISELKGIKVSGLMCVAPYTENSEENRVYFEELRQLSVDITRKNIDNISMDILSMGMSGDYEIAVQEGASYVRVGTSIFGERNYNI